MRIRSALVAVAAGVLVAGGGAGIAWATSAPAVPAPVTAGPAVDVPEPGDTPDVPGRPDRADAPGQPDAPDVPGRPDVPEAGDTPDVPGQN